MRIRPKEAPILSYPSDMAWIAGSFIFIPLISRRTDRPLRSEPMNPVENAESVDTRRASLIGQLEPDATKWRVTPGSHGLGRVLWCPDHHSGRPWMYNELRADPWGGVDEPERREAAVRPTRCGADEPDGACFKLSGRPLGRGR